MGQGSELIKNLPGGFNEADPTIQALFFDGDSDGALANEFEALINYVDSYTRSDDVENQTGEMLEKTVSFFIGMERYFEETDAALINRFMAITARAGDSVWGTGWNIKHVFEKYFPSANVFIVENTGESTANKLLDPDFEGETGWTLAGCTLETSARFSKSKGLLLPGSGTCKQIISLAVGTNSLNFFLKGSCSVKIIDASGNYWNGQNHSWQIAEYTNTFSSNEWANQQLFIITKSMTNITLNFCGVNGTLGYVDHGSLVEKFSYGTFTVVINFSGEVVGNVLHLSGGTKDPDAVAIPDYSKAGYFDQVFMTGVAAGFAKDIYQDILDLIKPFGIKAFLEFAERDYGA
jgi:hypothetical protein